MTSRPGLDRGLRTVNRVRCDRAFPFRAEKTSRAGFIRAAARSSCATALYERAELA